MPALAIALCQAELVNSQRIGLPRYVKQYRGCFLSCSSRTATASRFSGTPRGVPFLVRFNHAVLRSKSTRLHSKPVISLARQPVARANRTMGRDVAGTQQSTRPNALIPMGDWRGLPDTI